MSVRRVSSLPSRRRSRGLRRLFYLLCLLCLPCLLCCVACGSENAPSAASDSSNADVEQIRAADAGPQGADIAAADVDPTGAKDTGSQARVVADATSERQELSIEGKWVIELLPNTMYLFEKGVRYTYYCSVKDCAAFWETCKAGDENALPGTHPYTFVDSKLTIDLHFGNEFSQQVTFTCGGRALQYQAKDGSLVRWHRPNYDIASCDN